MRKKQINKEVIITIGLFIFYFLWWYYFAYLYIDSNDVSNFNYIFGLPEWFFYSCVIGLILMNILIFIAIKLNFKDMSLDNTKNNREEKK